MSLRKKSKKISIILKNLPSSLFFRLKRFQIFLLMRKDPIIIGGCGRSGTTLLLSILSAHPEIYTIPEETGIFCPGAFSSEFYTRERKIDIKKFYKKYFRVKLRGYSRWCEKTPKNVKFFKNILNYFNNKVKIIHIIRDGRDVIFSKHPSKPDKYWISKERWIGDVKAGLSLFYHPNVLTIKYEDLVLDFKNTTIKIMDFLELKKNKEIFDFFNYASLRKNPAWSSGLKPLHDKSIGRWKEAVGTVRYKEFMHDPEALALLKRLKYLV